MHPIIPPAIAAAFLLAQAQSPAPTSKEPDRIGNVWNNRDHQPTRAEERELQSAAGLRGNQAQRQSEDEELDELDNEILERAEQTGGGGSPGFMNPSGGSP
jgi:hypothetical protein